MTSTTQTYTTMRRGGLPLPPSWDRPEWDHLPPLQLMMVGEGVEMTEAEEDHQEDHQEDQDLAQTPLRNNHERSN